MRECRAIDGQVVGLPSAQDVCPVIYLGILAGAKPLALAMEDNPSGHEAYPFGPGWPLI